MEQHDLFNYTELLGYLASLVILISFLMKDIKKLRIINCVGCGLFVMYGVLLFSIPLIITNVAIMVINIVYLVKMIKSKE